MEELSAPSKVPAGTAAAEEKDAARLKVRPAKAADNLNRNVFFIVFTSVHFNTCLMTENIPKTRHGIRRANYNYITNVLNVKEILEKWVEFDKIVRFCMGKTREKWG